LGTAKDEYHPNAHGFDEYYGLKYSNDMIRPWVQTDKPLELYRNRDVIESHVDQNTLTTKYTEEAVKFIHDNAKTPFFLYLPYSSVHLPLAVPAEFRGKSKGGLYGDVVESLDWSAGKIVDALREAGVENDTLFVWTSDNGPWSNMPPRMLQAGPDGLDNKAWHAGNAGPFRSAKGTTYEGGVRVPAIFRWPGQIPGGQIIQELARTLDLLPTALNLAGAKIPTDRPIDGVDILPLLKGQVKESPVKTHYYFAGKRLDAVRKGQWKLQLASGKEELFQIEQDFTERANVAADHPEIVTELRGLLEAFSKETDTPLPKPETKVSMLTS